MTTPDSPAERGAAALAAALAYLIASTDEGCILEQIVLHGIYTDGRSGYAGTARRTITPDELGAVLKERDDLGEKLAAATRTIASLADQLRTQDLGDRAEELLAESRVHWPATEDRQPRAAYETTCGDMRGRSTMIASAVTCPACRAWMSGDDERAERQHRAADAIQDLTLEFFAKEDPT